MRASVKSRRLATPRVARGPELYDMAPMSEPPSIHYMAVDKDSRKDKEEQLREKSIAEPVMRPFSYVQKPAREKPTSEPVFDLLSADETVYMDVMAPKGAISHPPSGAMDFKSRPIPARRMKLSSVMMGGGGPPMPQPPAEDAPQPPMVKSSPIFSPPDYRGVMVGMGNVELSAPHSAEREKETRLVSTVFYEEIDKILGEEVDSRIPTYRKKLHRRERRDEESVMMMRASRREASKELIPLMLGDDSGGERKSHSGTLNT